MAIGRDFFDKDKFNQPTHRKVLYVALIANLLLVVRQKGLKRSWNFSGLATMFRISLMYCVDFRSLFNNLEKDWERILARPSVRCPELPLCN